MALAPRLEKQYDARKGERYKLVHNEEKGIHMVASHKIDGGELVLIEKPLHSQPVGYSPSLRQRREVASLLATISRFAKSHGHLSGLDQYPPEACEAMNRLTELKAMDMVSTSPQIDEIWQLHDAHRQSGIGDMVMIDGLVSDAGKKLNGKIGRVLKRDKKDTARLCVSIGVGSQATEKSIKQVNLKTLGGDYANQHVPQQR